MYVETLQLNTIEIHNLANSTPTMSPEDYQALVADIDLNGQIETVKLWEGKVIDGRHRCKALAELGIDTVTATRLDPIWQEDDVVSYILSLETRRHQSATQKAIYAHKMYYVDKAKGVKTSQGTICKRVGISRAVMVRVETLRKLAGDVIIQHLFEGKKLDIANEEGKVYKTDSLQSLINYYKRITDDMVIDDEPEVNLDNLTDEENTKVQKEIIRLTAEYSYREQKAINAGLYSNYRAFIK